MPHIWFLFSFSHVPFAEDVRLFSENPEKKLNENSFLAAARKQWGLIFHAENVHS